MGSMEEVLDKLSQLRFHVLSSEELVKLNPLDKFKEELIVMVEVSAYFLVAYKVVSVASGDMEGGLIHTACSM